MQVHISGRHVELGASFQSHAEKRLTEGLGKYLDRVTSVDVVVSKEAHHQFKVAIHGNPGTHSDVTIKSEGHAGEIYAAFDDAATKAEKQLRRYSRRLKNHHRSDEKSATARKYVLQTEPHDDELAEEGAPVVLAEKSTNIEKLSVSQAVMKMDLADLPALLFFNSGTGRINVVYRRADGNISWVDPEVAAA